MATLVWLNAYVLINAVDLSDHVRQITLSYEAELLDETAMAASLTTRKMKAGLLNWTLDIEFFQDFAASKVDATIFPLVGAVAFAIAVKPVNGVAISATNPEYQGNVVVSSYPIIAGAVGEIAVAAVKMHSASVLVRDITP